MIKFDLSPNKKKLSQFGWIGLFGFSVIGFIIAIKIDSFNGSASFLIPSICWSLAIVSPILSLTFPRGLLPLYLILSLVAIPIGIIVSNIILMVIFYLLISPIAIFFRLIGRDELKIRKNSHHENTFWIKQDSSKGLESYYRQF
tara:strand:+ start:31 stop:462 length:432 start_codon:yes stop_codon:yes gene_type:complete